MSAKGNNGNRARMTRGWLRSYMGGTAKRMVGPRISDYLRSLRIRNLPSTSTYRSYLRGRKALEIGGPSEIFSLGPLPIYAVLRGVDNCNYAARTLWSVSGKKFGKTFICEASHLAPIPDQTYDCILSSHSLEHIANPLKALYEWKRVLTRNGLLLLILPNKECTFDWRRSVTPLEHIISDYNNHTGENDLTHLNEILELHDLTKDPAAGTFEEFRTRCLHNAAVRAIHHHVFNLASALSLVGYAGFSPLISEVNLPNDIIVLARVV